jgi:hypothetical protein
MKRKETNKPKDLRALLSGNSNKDEEKTNASSNLRGFIR